jgi:hypothetical protein
MSAAQPQNKPFSIANLEKISQTNNTLQGIVPPPKKE